MGLGWSWREGLYMGMMDTIQCNVMVEGETYRGPTFWCYAGRKNKKGGGGGGFHGRKDEDHMKRSSRGGGSGGRG